MPSSLYFHYIIACFYFICIISKFLHFTINSGLYHVIKYDTIFLDIVIANAVLMKKGFFMVKQLLFAEYFYQWMKTFKKPAIAPVTYIKYKNTYEHIKNYFGTIELAAISRQDYQAALNKFAKTHAKRTTAGFHKQMRAAVLDALEENFISTDFTRKAIIGGRDKEKNKAMFLSYSEWKTLINYTKTASNSYDFIIYLSAMTGLRFAEVLGLTVADIDLKNKSLTVNKTWDYKYHTGFKAPKNSNSVRTIDIDTQTLRVIKK